MAHNIRKSQKTKIQDKAVIFWEFRAENPFSEVPQSSCIVWDTQGPFLRHVYFFDFRPAGQKPTKICRNGYLFPFPWRKQARGTCPSQRAPDLKVHSQIESSVRPNGTPVRPIWSFQLFDQDKTNNNCSKTVAVSLPLRKPALGTLPMWKSAEFGDR